MPALSRKRKASRAQWNKRKKARRLEDSEPEIETRSENQILPLNFVPRKPETVARRGSVLNIDENCALFPVPLQDLSNPLEKFEDWWKLVRVDPGKFIKTIVSIRK